ncbi:uncharacterized protein LOC107042006 [Diachasma alloeum]|uniref:uncharacterized protein LOC107042006 n=1 Tax=Diachasma alloeum TaxID=454923 RepID=UPI000738347F|nr:uncharacterized protein LOC107042006 [Diachasma alloeum]
MLRSRLVVLLGICVYCVNTQEDGMILDARVSTDFHHFENHPIQSPNTPSRKSGDYSHLNLRGSQRPKDAAVTHKSVPHFIENRSVWNRLRRSAPQLDGSNQQVDPSVENRRIRRWLGVKRPLPSYLPIHRRRYTRPRFPTRHVPHAVHLHHRPLLPIRKPLLPPRFRRRPLRPLLPLHIHRY